MKLHDLVIVGAGPAGMSAALFAEGDGLNYRLFEKAKPCGFVEEVINTNFTRLENYLGLWGIDGTELQARFMDHLASRSIPIDSEDIVEIKDVQDSFIISSAQSSCESKSIILATGTTPKKLRVNGIEKVPNRVHYGVRPEFRDYSGKTVLVVGGRNSGAVTAVRLKELGCSPLVIERGLVSTAKPKYMERLSELGISYHLNSTLERVIGDNEIDSVELTVQGARSLLHPVAIFGCVGYEPNNALAQSLGLELDKEGYVVVDRNMRTSNKRIFAAGDVNGGVKMIAVAVGEGATAEYYVNALVRSK